MQIRCDCGIFRAELAAFPRNPPGRLVCYCDDCQSYLEKLGRQDLLDPYDGTEIVPVYPSEFNIVSGQQALRCNRLSEQGLNRWSTTCCNSPIANTRARFPWVGLIHSTFTVDDPTYLEKTFGAVRSRIYGRYAKEGHPFPIAEKMGLKDMLAVLPFLLKGFMLKKHRHSQFFKDDGTSPIAEPSILS
ncbi:MAG: hypothetical protein IPJ88_11875 [Myxococcales bacterium]|nr:MAG: hypothetical protein IPJ88_11875 [Myxococcales bacterium]